MKRSDKFVLILIGIFLILCFIPVIKLTGLVSDSSGELSVSEGGNWGEDFPGKISIVQYSPESGAALKVSDGGIGLCFKIEAENSNFNCSVNIDGIREKRFQISAGKSEVLDSCIEKGINKGIHVWAVECLNGDNKHSSTSFFGIY